MGDDRRILDLEDRTWRLDLAGLESRVLGAEQRLWQAWMTGGSIVTPPPTTVQTPACTAPIPLTLTATDGDYGPCTITYQGLVATPLGFATSLYHLWLGCITASIPAYGAGVNHCLPATTTLQYSLAIVAAGHPGPGTVYTSINYNYDHIYNFGGPQYCALNSTASCSSTFTKATFMNVNSVGCSPFSATSNIAGGPLYGGYNVATTFG